MQLEQAEKELAAIGASIGANCRPCIEHHLAAGRDAGLSDAELADAVAIAEGLRQEAIDELSAHVAQLLGCDGAPPALRADADGSTAHELAALGASVGANAHALLRTHVVRALEAGMSAEQVRAAVKMAEYVQKRAAEITANKATAALQELGTGAAVRTGLGSST